MRRYQALFWPLMVVYAVVLYTVIKRFETDAPTGAMRYAAAIAPAIPLLGVIFALGRYVVEETDEFARLKLVMALLGGLGFTLAVTTVWGFLEVLAGVPQVPLYHVFPIFCIGMGLSQPIVWWRYR
jgi:hypothetical protein